MNKKLWLLILSVVLIFNLAGCSTKTVNNGNILDQDFEELLEAAKGTTVTFYGWGGSQQTNSWIDGYLSENVKKDYDITVKRVGMNIDEILNSLLNEKQLNVEKGNIDVVWINGENFFTAKENNLLFGPFTDKLPNFNKYVDKDSPDVKYDFGYPVEGYEAPYGKAQMVMVYDSEKVDKTPVDHKELLEWAKKNPGKFTYPALPDFTGSAFVRNIICDIVGYEQFMDMDADEETVRKAIEPAIEYLKELKPYLWKEGKTYPGDAPLLDNMYADGEVWMTMTYNPNSASGKIATGEYKESTRTFIFDKGTIGNTHFLAIPFNAPNKAGAMALINYILNVESQATKYEPETWGDLPVLDNDKLSQGEKDRFASIPLGMATLPQDVLLEHRIPEMPADLVPIIEKIWMEMIPGEGE
ncbi:ABC transporter substrate-binding protein [uncultured Tissierella sp.]|jgi:putative spermidine/putrescine transport system substrate-binding protein|uniref:ABC transporter substrate-binding protein n=1 Tax=uncultured Tissierella sp. TaxID=448160 RepID=UPI002803CF51|nr:ABC transporter substrate-binding protein [uncultured Tissierella sp.]MDU5080479.1 ABC transporter substrate-binding protein [Bacillota bacterium]